MEKKSHYSFDDVLFKSIIDDFNWFGTRPNETFYTEESFVSLIHSVHENYHLLQGLTSGYSLWRWSTKCELSYYTSKYVKSLKGKIEYPLILKFPKKTTYNIDYDDYQEIIQFYNYDYGYACDLLGKSETLNRVLHVDLDSHPLRSRLTDEIFELTSRDLLECHASINTEFFINRAMQATPKRFSLEVAKQYESIYKVMELSDEHKRPLKLVINLFGNYIGSQNYTHPYYKNIENPWAYYLTGFLIDYALHIPPEPLLIYAKKFDICTLEDILPPIRFIKLLFAFWNLMKLNTIDLNILLNEPKYYSDVSKALCDEANRMNKVAREKNGDEAAITFYDLNKTSSMWKEYLKSMKFGRLFSRGIDVRVRALDFRIDHPSHYIENLPYMLQIASKIPILYIRGDKLHIIPYIDSEYVDPDSDEIFKDAVELTKALNYEIDYKESERLKDKPDTFAPFRYMEDIVRENLFNTAADFIFKSGKARCPYTYSLGGYLTCKERYSGCEDIKNLWDYPCSSLCKLKATIEEYFCNPDNLVFRE